MAQVSYGTITISDLTDITDIFLEYCLVKDTTTLEELLTPNYFYTYFVTDDTSYSGDQKDYFTRTLVDGVYVYTIVKVNTEDNPHDLGYYERNYIDINEKDWASIPPAWIEGYNIWVRPVQIFSEIEEPVYGTPYVDSTLNTLNTIVLDHTINIDSLNTKLKYFWDHIPIGDESESESYPYGTYMAAGIEGLPLKTNNSQTYGYNSLLRHSAISFRYNDVNLTTMGQDGIILYYLPNVNYHLSADTVVNNSKIYYEQIILDEQTSYFPILEPTGNPTTNQYYELSIESGKKGLELSTEGLFLYQPNDNVNNVIELSQDGLIIQDGSIIIGTTKDNLANNNSGSIALTRTNFSRTILDNMTVNNLRFAIGDSFAVSESGQLFAKDVVITGDIYAGANSNVYTKDEVLSKEQVESTYVSNTAAQQQFLSIEGQVKDMQIIYKSISSTGTIDNYGTNWCTRSDDVNNAWTLTRPTYNASYPKVYYSIQIKTQNDEVKTSAPKLDTGMSDILTSDGTIDSSKIDISNFNIGDLSGSLSSTVITNSGLATTAEVTNKISTLNNTIASDYIPKSNNFWKQLNSNIVINATTAPYSIDIAVDAQRTSYLHLTGEQINFVVNNTEGALIVQPDGIKTEYIRTRYIHMGRDIGTPTLGWVLRDNQHLSLKVL